MKSKITTLEDAVSKIKDNDMVGVSGFAGAGVAEEILVEIENKFLNKGAPKNLGVIYAAGIGNWKDGGIEHLAHEGLIKKVIAGHFDTCRNLVSLINNNKIEGYNFPQGIICQLYRSVAARQPGVLTKIGLQTYIDPINGGGKMNSITKEDMISNINIGEDDWLLYKSFPINVAIIRGTTADEIGNITMEEEALFAEALELAQAVKASGGTVIAQVKNIVKTETLDAQNVKIPAVLVDCIVKSKYPEKYHKQTWNEYYSPEMAGHLKAIKKSITPMEMDIRKVIARRAIMELDLTVGTVVNLGVGIPEGVSSVATEEGVGNNLILTVEAGGIGGIPAGGLNFGAAINPWAIMPMSSQFDFYDGGGLDVAFLGLAQADKFGNINVSKFGPKIAGCGGFINISQNTKSVVFCGSFTAGGLEIEIKDGKMHIITEGKHKKFINNVEQITFSGEYAAKNNQRAVYVTERAVFEVSEEGLVLTEIAPGIDLERDILKQMEFEPKISENLKIMDSRIFINDTMKIY